MAWHSPIQVESLHELTRLTLDWLDLHYRGRIICIDSIRNPYGDSYRNFDTIALGSSTSTFINVMKDGYCFFLPSRYESAGEVKAADPTYFARLQELIEIWDTHAVGEMA